MADAAVHPARLLVSSTRKPISYVPAAKRMLQEHGEVHLSALGVACSSMVTVAEILKSRNLAVEKRVGTMLELLEDEPRPRQKPKMEVLLAKSAEFDTLVAAEKEAVADAAAVEAPAAHIEQGKEGEVPEATKGDASAAAAADGAGKEELAEPAAA